MIDIEKAKKVFNDYVENYDKNNPRIAFKIAHTYRVVDVAEKISKELKLDEEQVNLAMLIGLLHDIGRFEQVRKYDTFEDKLSEDHADLGVKILQENNFISEFCEDEKYYNTILVAIKNHNKFKIAENLTEEEILQAKLVRDADKIDILKSITIENLDVLMDDDNINNSKISNEILDDFYHERQTKRALLKTPMDEYISYVGMIFDINFIPSLKILKEKGYINTIIDKCKNEEMPNIRKFINNYMDKRISNG